MSVAFRKLRFGVSALLAMLAAAWPAAGQDRATVEDFSVHLFLNDTGKLSPDVIRAKEFIAWNFHAIGADFEGGHFSGYLISLKFRAPREIFAKGPQARVELRDQKSKKVLRQFTVADLYVGDARVTFHPIFVSGLDCQAVDIVVTSGGRRISKNLPLACGE
jgi:hypothetical protein